MQWQETRDDVRKLLCTLFKSWNIYLCRSLFNPMPWLVCLNGLMHQMVYLQLLYALCRFQPSLGLYSELPAAGPWAGPGAVCSGGPRSCCQKWLCGAVHFTFYKLSHRCLLRFSLQVSLHSQMFFLICVILFFLFLLPTQVIDIFTYWRQMVLAFLLLHSLSMSKWLAEVFLSKLWLSVLPLPKAKRDTHLNKTIRYLDNEGPWKEELRV